MFEDDETLQTALVIILSKDLPHRVTYAVSPKENFINPGQETRCKTCSIMPCTIHSGTRCVHMRLLLSPPNNFCHFRLLIAWLPSVTSQYLWVRSFQNHKTREGAFLRLVANYFKIFLIKKKKIVTMFALWEWGRKKIKIVFS